MRLSRPKFTLTVRGMMIAVLLVGGTIGWKVRRAAIQRRAVAAISRAGGHVVYDFQIKAVREDDDNPQPWAPGWLRRVLGDEWFQEVNEVFLTDTDLTETKQSDDLLAAVTTLDRLEKLEIDMQAINATSLVPLIRLTRLKELTLVPDQTTDSWLADLEKIRFLETLYLEYNEGTPTRAILDRLAALRWLKELGIGARDTIGPADLGSLAKMTHLKSLAVTSPEEGAYLVSLRGLTGLRKLYLSDTRPTDDELANLAGLTRLEALWVDFSQVTDAGLAHLAGLKSLTELRLESGGPFSDAAMVHLSVMVGLTELDLPNSRLTEAGIAHLQRLTKLTRLDLKKTQVTDAGIAHLAGMKSLTELQLDTSGPLSDLAMSQIAGMSQLETLSLHGPGVTDSGLAHLAGLSELAMLYLDGSSVTGLGLANLARLIKIEYLGLSNTKLTDSGLDHLAELPSLLSLNLSNTAVSDAGLAHLAKSPHLWKLDLDGTAVTDAGLAVLTGIPTLRLLHLDGTKVTDAGLARSRGAPALVALSVRDTQISRRAIDAFRLARPKVNLEGPFDPAGSPD
jgi:internalin A